MRECPLLNEAGHQHPSRAFLFNFGFMKMPAVVSENSSLNMTSPWISPFFLTGMLIFISIFNTPGDLGRL